MPRDLVDVEVAERGLERSPHRARRAHADGVGHVHALDTDAFHQAGEVAHALGGDGALVGTADGAAHRAAHGDARRARGRDHGREALDALGNGAIDILLAERLAGRAEHDDLVGAVGHGGLEALQVGRQHRITHARMARDAGHDRVVVGHLRYPLGRHIARDFDFLQAGCLQAVHQFNLDVRRHRLFFVLQAVARADVDDADAGGEGHVYVLGWCSGAGLGSVGEGQIRVPPQ